MNKTNATNYTRRNARTVNAPSAGLLVRTNLRAGLAWDDLDDQAAALWGKMTNAVSNASNALTAGGAASKPAA